MTVTITNRQGISKSVNIGFEILQEHVYPSVDAMNADAANVRAGQFCMIATTDPTSPDNAQLWSRNSSAATSEHPFTFLSDLDQASTAAFADWLENYKPVIEADHRQAVLDHGVATQDHQTSTSDHSVATQDHQTSTSDHNVATQDHQTSTSDHQQYESDTLRAGQDHNVATQDHQTSTSDHQQYESDTQRAGQDHQTATADHQQYESDTQRSGRDHQTATSDHQQHEADTERAGQDHQTATSDHQISSEQQGTFEQNEQNRQDTFDANEAQRQQDFEDAEDDRIAAMTVTRCFVRFQNMHLVFVQPASDSTQYKVRRGRLKIITSYEM